MEQYSAIRVWPMTALARVIVGSAPGFGPNQARLGAIPSQDETCQGRFPTEKKAHGWFASGGSLDRERYSLFHHL